MTARDPFEPPTLVEELDRKTYEVLERLVRQHAQGKIGTEALQVGLRSVWETVAGLASESMSALASQMHTTAAREQTKVARIFRDPIDGTFACAVDWTPSGSWVRVLKPSGETRVESFDNAQLALEYFVKLCSELGRRYSEWE